MKPRWFPALFLGLSLGGGMRAGESGGGSFVVVAKTVDGGGGTSRGGAFALTGAIGQSDAGLLKGGAFVLHGGFMGVSIASTVGGDARIALSPDGAGNVVLTWNVDGYALEFRDALSGGPPDWQPVALSPAGRNFTTPASQPARFFRLRKSPAGNSPRTH